MVQLPTLAVASVFALSVGLIAQATGVNEERCPSTFTWRTSAGNQYGYQLLNADMCGSSSTCGNKFPKPEGLEDRPPPVGDSVDLSFFGIILDPTKNSTCLGIKYTLDRYGASKVKGIQFLLHGLGYNSHNTQCCQVLNYTVELSYEAVVTNPNSGNLRQFSFDCFCDLWPQEPYTLTITTLPVDFENQTLLDPSRIVKDFKVPGCTSDREWDQYCQKSKEELWKPQLLVPEQLFTDYLELNVTFNIAPSDYRFSEYVINVNELDVAKPIHTKVAYASSLTYNTVMVSGLMLNVSSKIFTLDEEDVGKTVHASMFPRCEIGVPDCNTPTYQDKTNVVLIIEDPCNSDPCGELGTCEPNEHLYNCVCNKEAILDRHPVLDGDTCIDNPCNSNPCSNLGTCGLEGVDYYCNCTSAAINNGITCIPDPCNPNPCDKYSMCRHNEDFQPECFCTNGVTCIVDKCQIEDVEPSPCITMASCGESSLDLVEGWKYHDCSCRYEVINSTNVTNVCADGTCDASSCDKHSYCKYFDIPGGVRYNCSCITGYSFNEEGMCEKDRTVYLWVIVVVAVFLLVVALTVGFKYMIKTRLKNTCVQGIPYNQDEISISPSPQEPNPNNHLHDGNTGQTDYQLVPGNRWPLPEGGTAGPPNNEPNKRILIISTEETEEHRNVVYKFAIFLKNHAGLCPIIPSQNTHDIHRLTLETWLSNENRLAFKVLFICSLGMWDRWDRERRGDPNPNRRIPVESEFGDPFIQMKHITSTERCKPGMLNKFAVAFFSDYFDKGKVEDMDLFRGMPRYSLMSDVEKLCFILNGIEQNTPTSCRRMPRIKEYENIPEGRALLQAIKVMMSKHGVPLPNRGIQHQSSQMSADIDLTPPSERSVSGHFELNSREGSENSVQFQEITEDEQQAMASASGFFSNSCSNSDDESSDCGRLQVEIHRESRDDVGFPQAQVDCEHFVAVSLKSDEYSLNELDSGLSTLPTSSLSSKQESVPMAGHLTSLNSSGLDQPMPAEASPMDACVMHVPSKPEEYTSDVLDSGLHSQPTSCITGASSLA